MAREACATRATSQEPNGTLTVAPQRTQRRRFACASVCHRVRPTLASQATSDRREHTRVRRLVEYGWRHGGVTALREPSGADTIGVMGDRCWDLRERICCPAPKTQHPTPKTPEAR